MNDNTVQPIEQKQVDFYGDELTAVRTGDGQIYASLPSMCSALGLQISTQTKRIKRHDVLSEGYQVVSITYTSKMDVPTKQGRHCAIVKSRLHTSSGRIIRKSESTDIL